MKAEKGNIVRQTGFCRNILLLGLSLLSWQGWSQCNVHAAFSHQTLCTGYTVAFTDQSTSDTTLASWEWMFGGPPNLSLLQHPVFTFPAPGTYTIQLIVTDHRGCRDTLVRSLSLAPPLVPVFSADTLCAGQSVTFTDLTPAGAGRISSWHWDFGDGNSQYGTAQATHTYATSFTPLSRTISLTLTDTLGCLWVGQAQLPILPLPQPVIGHQLNCGSNIVQFNDLGVYPIPAASWLWDFGDNAMSSSANPIHLYPSQGVYTASLQVTTIQGCAAEVSQLVHVASPLSIDFQGFTICQHDSAQLLAQLIGGTAPVSSWTWDFGDGGAAYVQLPWHAFHMAGTMLVTLTAEDTLGCTVSLSRQVIVVAPPIASFKANSVFFGTPTEFVDASQQGTLPIAHRSLDFGDGAPPLITAYDTTYHNYAYPGSFQATLHLSDAFGCGDTHEQLLEVWSNYLKPSWVADTVCTGMATTFSDQTMVGSGSILSWYWDLGDQTISQLQNPVHSYDSAGLYQVKLVVTTDLGITDSAMATVVVYASPKADFDYSPSCEDDKKVFYNLTTLETGNIMLWHWELGQGVTSTAARPERIYHEPGTYQVTLVATSDHGCIDSATHNLVVGPMPRVVFGANKYSGCERADIQFTDSSTVSSGQITSWLWNFGDGSFSTDPVIAKHAFEDHGSYYVILTVITDLGCEATLMNPAMITVHPDPVAEFEFSPDDADIHRPTVFFINQSVGADKFVWNFGDGHSTTVFEPAHNYTSPGLFTISLKAETRYGCVNYRYKEIMVKSEPVLFLPDAFTPNGDGLNDYFAPAGTAYTDEGAVTFSFQIFDRLGNLLFDSPGDLTPWDGRIRGGVNAPEGVYVCRLVQQDPDGKKHTRVGAVTLMR
ncbi:MAG TPA: PKD domain-containing protein [Bacteroidales bacterium]|nr:PKD domain-containing protein [Bacteroidales bacterium]HRZ75913.1 PKD domain-containing protein [Bacteroidales bacterium]